MCRSTKQPFGNYNLIRQENFCRQQYHATVVLQKGFFFTKHEKKGMCFFAEGSKWYVRKFHASQKIYYTNIHIDIQCLTCTNITSHKCYISQLHKSLVFHQNFLSSFIQKFVDSFVNSFFSNSYSFQCRLHCWISFGIIGLRWP